MDNGNALWTTLAWIAATLFFMWLLCRKPKEQEKKEEPKEEKKPRHIYIMLRAEEIEEEKK